MKLSVQGHGDALGEAGLARAGRAHEQQDGRFVHRALSDGGHLGRRLLDVAGLDEFLAISIGLRFGRLTLQFELPLQAQDCEVFQKTLLYLLQAVVVVIELLPCSGEGGVVQLIVGSLRPRDLSDGKAVSASR